MTNSRNAQDDTLLLATHLRPRHDGWTLDRQRTFLTILAETGSVAHAAAAAGKSRTAAYRLRADPRAGNFAVGWDAALRFAARRTAPMPRLAPASTIMPLPLAQPETIEDAALRIIADVDPALFETAMVLAARQREATMR